MDLNTLNVTIDDYQDSERDEVKALIKSLDFECGDTLPDIGVVALFNGQVVGYIGGHLSYGNNSFINILVVNEAAQKLGIAKELMKAMVKKLLSLGIERFEATVNVDSTIAIDIYKKLDIELTPVFRLEGLLKEVDEKLNVQPRC